MGLPPLYEELLDFIRERENVRRKHDAHLPRPWTDDPILHTYRFCNIHREDDRVTRWIADNWRSPHAEDPDLWFAMLVARLTNLPSTMAWIGYPIPWEPEKVREFMKDIRTQGRKLFNPAYLIGTQGTAGDKVDFLVDMVWSKMWADRMKIRPRPGDTLEEFSKRMLPYFGMGTFIVGQVIADVKYVLPLRVAADWRSFAMSGPGSRRGLNRVLGRPVTTRWREDDWRAEMATLHNSIRNPEMHRQDLQNCLCEFDKYQRAVTGEGRPKQFYWG